MKRCGSCQVEKPIEEFSKNKARKDGRQSLCRLCKSSVQRAYYEANKESYLEVSNRNRLARKKRNRQFVVEYLLNHPCVDCGESDIHVLEFDHVRGTKIHGVGRLIADGIGLDKLQAEIEKCEVRCCNCHRRVTFERMGVDFTEFI